MNTRHVLRRIVDSEPVSGLMGAVEGLTSRHTDLLRVLTYHRIFEADGFERAIDHLLARYRFISAKTLLEAVAGAGELPPRSLLLTFDDAYREFADIAWPVLRSRGVPTLLFVATDYPDNDELVFWWDRLEHAFETTGRTDVIDSPIGPLKLHDSEARRRGFYRMLFHLKTCSHDVMLGYVDEICHSLGTDDCSSHVLGWDALRRLSREGVTVGSHTRSHPLLNRLPDDRAREEIMGGQERLLRELGSSLPIFAYPGGHYNRRARDFLDEIGMKVAFTTIRGTNDLKREDPLLLRRINIGSYANRGVVQMRLLESVRLLNRWRPVPQATG